ncbi:hypothetical protein ACSBR2_006670 [Camellia fascicularis]
MEFVSPIFDLDPVCDGGGRDFEHLRMTPNAINYYKVCNCKRDVLPDNGDGVFPCKNKTMVKATRLEVLVVAILGYKSMKAFIYPNFLYYGGMVSRCHGLHDSCT